MSEPRPLEEYLADVQKALEQGEDDPELSHADVDGLVEEAVLAFPTNPDAPVMLAAAGMLLTASADWTRWYA